MKKQKNPQLKKMEKKFIDESIKINNVNIDLNDNERESKEIILNFNKYNPSELKQEIDEQIMIFFMKKFHIVMLVHMSEDLKK